MSDQENIEKINYFLRGMKQKAEGIILKVESLTQRTDPLIGKMDDVQSAYNALRSVDNDLENINDWSFNPWSE